MVSFQCDACQDVVKKPKLDNHRARCNASFTCIDCSITFAGPHQYKAHTSCISEAQKYEKGLYKASKGTTAANGGYQNGRQNDRRYNQPNRSRGTGSNGHPLGDDVKMTWTPPNEETTTQKAAVVHPADTVPVSGLARNTVAEEANETPNESASGEKKKLEKREPPPPGETKAERKKRKKIERTAKKAEKLKMKEQMRAAKAKVLAAKRREKRAKREEQRIQRRPDGAAPNVALPEDANTNVMAPPASETAIEETQVQPTESKKLNRLEEVNRDSEMQSGPSNDVEKTEKRKKKKKSRKEESAEMDIDPVPVEGQGDVEKAEKKSKKRKREVDDVGGEDTVDDMAELSFKGRAKAERRARKAEKAARKALQASIA